MLIKEPNTSTGDWEMRKVSKIYPDPQRVVRKANVQDSVQAVNQLVPLPKKRNSQNPKFEAVSGKNTSVTQALITWLVFVSTNTLNFTILSPGFHLFDINKIFIKGHRSELIY